MPQLRRRYSLRWCLIAVGLTAVVFGFVRILPSPWPAAFWLIGGVGIVLFTVGLTIPTLATTLAIAYVLALLCQPSITPDHSRRNRREQLVRVVRDSAP